VVGVSWPNFPLRVQGALCNGTAAAQKNKSCGQWEFQGLISRTGLRERSFVVLLLAQESKAYQQWEFLGLISPWASGSSVIWGCCQGNQACLLAPFVTCRTAGAMGPAYTGASVSLVFQVMDSGDVEL
jgi:hypothetical protein